MSRKIRFINAVAISLYISIGLLIAFIVIWNYPRQTVDLDFYTVEGDNFNIGDEIFVTSLATVHMDGISTYDHRLVCDRGRYLLKAQEFRSSPREQTRVRGSVGIIPAIQRPDECKVSTNKCHEIKIIFNIHRTYCDVVETNKIRVN